MIENGQEVSFPTTNSVMNITDITKVTRSGRVFGPVFSKGVEDVSKKVEVPVANPVSAIKLKMSRKVDSVKDSNDSKETWRLVVQIMDVWSVVNNKGIEHLEMIVMDSLVLIRHDHLLKWKEVIKENMTCIINNGSVYNNDFQWKVCDHSKKFVFLGGTTMKAIELQNIPPKGYFFKDFGEILQGKCKTDRLEDIIGAVSEINHIQSNTPGKKVVVSVVLKDLK
ncbi:uncharacterized protein LOC127101895 [Lathyrus oleraceus]|uniref:uncharacterized protein LOC127101895 n=1 Tax=Pisum sativum TaxID=3888 RepID=UPI0021CF263A|nr:uncharacterized protein LOC127101895 [Pisum sativum]